MRFRQVTFIAGGCFIIAAAALAFTGSVILIDPRREIASAQLIDGWGHTQPLVNLAFVRVGVPRIEGAVQIRCRNGTVVEWGYVTPGAPTWGKMDDKVGCSTTLA